MVNLQVLDNPVLLLPPVTATPEGLFSEGCRLWGLHEEPGVLATRWAELARAAARA